MLTGKSDYPGMFAFDELALSTPNSLWGAFTMSTLVRLGVECCVVSPGSRSTPLALAAARTGGLEAISILDERSAGFFALGRARATGRPVALVCTSGSALANYWPAVVEAHESGVPLLILSADRPPELRNCGAGQTIDQIKFFGSYATQFTELALPEATSAALGYLRERLATAVSTAMGARRGPVHLNFPFREPLVPVQGATAVMDAVMVERLLPHNAEKRYLDAEVGSVDLADKHFCEAERGLIVVGAQSSNESDAIFSKSIFDAAKALGWPVLADVGSPLRFVESDGFVIAHYDALLREPGFASAAKPDCVIQIGQLPTSKVLRSWLGEMEADTIIVSERGQGLDPLQRCPRVVTAAVPLFLTALSRSTLNTAGNGAWLHSWRLADAAAAAEIAKSLEQAEAHFEPAWVRALQTGLAGLETQLVLASSMPIRDAEFFISTGSVRGRCFASRGANGIDGTLSTAMGAAHGAGLPTVLVTGDLAFLHDSNGLLAASVMSGSLLVILINNSGGGIFEHLPIAGFGPSFEQFFATSQTVDFSRLAAAHGVEFETVADWKMLLSAVKARIGRPGLRILEVKTCRKQSPRGRSALLESAAAAGFAAVKGNL